MIQNIQYIFHLVIQSKYKIVINILVYTTIYLTINNEQIAFCMTENNDLGSIPAIAESKDVIRPSQQFLALKREIDSYAGAQLHLLEHVDEQARIIAEQKQTIEELTNTIKGSIKTTYYGSFRSGGLEETISDLRNQIRRLESVETKLTQDLMKAQAVIDEYRQFIYRK